MNDTIGSGGEAFRLKWTLRWKIGGLVGLLLGLLLMTVLFSSLKILSINGEVSEIADTDLPMIGFVTAVESLQLRQHADLEKMLSGLHDEGREQEIRVEAMKHFEGLGREMEDAMKKADTLLTNLDAAGFGEAEYRKLTESTARLKKEHGDFQEASEKILAQLRSGRRQGLQEQMDRVEKEAADLDDAASSLQGDLEKFTEASSRSAEKHEATGLRGNAFLGLFSLGLGVGLSLFLLGQLGRTITALTKRARAVAAGDLTSERIPVLTTDELGELSLTFNDMTESLRDIVRQNRAGTENLNSSSAEILASTQQQASSTKEQAAAVQETTATMEEVRQSGTQISERAKQVAAEAEAASSVTNMGLEAVKETVRTMESIREQVEQVAENIVALSEKNQAVGDIVATVNDIAEQSKLLALNAAIEASTAGEQGSRFSVVANEMKNLADQAKESTVQVRAILGDIQKGITSAVMQTEEAVKRTESGKQRADGADRSIRQMAASMEKSIQAFQQIVAATNQQHIGFEQVTQALQDIRQATEQTAAGTNQLEKAMVNLNALAQQLRKSVERYKA